MEIKPKFDIDKLFADVGRKVNIFAEGVVEAVEKTCLEITTAAKQLDTYKDQTNVLRSSIGYVVYRRGEKVAEFFAAAGAGLDGSGAEGIERGKQVANQAATEYPNDIVGVMVAGADYALYVESKGYDVLTGPASLLMTTFQKNLRLVLDGLKA
jgi:hypothetical protein